MWKGCNICDLCVLGVFCALAHTSPVHLGDLGACVKIFILPFYLVNIPDKMGSVNL